MNTSAHDPQALSGVAAGGGGGAVSRRGFLKAVGRAAGLAALGALLWRLGAFGRKGWMRGRSVCAACRALPVCSRPEALRERDAMGAAARAAPRDLRPADRLCEGGPPSASPPEA